MEQKQVAAVILFWVAFIGTTANFLVVFFNRKINNLKSAFGRLMISQAIGELFICANFCFFFAPMMFFDIKSFVEISPHVGYLCLIAYDICLWSHLFLSINRWIALTFPFKYERIFSSTTTWCIITFIWVVSVILSTVLFKIVHCNMPYADSVWAYLFEQNTSCNFIVPNIIFPKDMVFIGLIALTDALTLWAVKKANQITVLPAGQSARKRQIELQFVKQTILQGALFILELLSYMKFAWFFQNIWIIFFMTSVAWAAVHGVDAIIIIAMNSEFRRFILKHFVTVNPTVMQSQTPSIRVDPY